MRLVLDTSVIIKWLNQTRENNLDQADRLLADALAGKVELFTPQFAKQETGNVLLLSKLLKPGEANKVLEAFYALPITFIAESLELAQFSFALARELNITYYDASFLALAQQLEATLITENLKHQGKASEIKVIPLCDY